MLRIRLSVTDARQHLDAAKHHSPQDEQQRDRVGPRRSMSPRPYGAPNAARRYNARRAKITEEAGATARVVRPDQQCDAGGDGQQQAEVYGPTGRLALNARLTRW